MIQPSQIESARFGFRIARADPATSTVEEIDSAALSQGIEMVVARVDVDQLAIGQRLEEAGFRLMDTLVYVERDLKKDWPESGEYDGFAVKIATPDDARGASDVAEKAFARYMGHYHTDPRLDDRSAAAGYGEWAENLVIGSDEKAPTFVALSGKQIIGFLATARIDDSKIDIVLNAVDPKRKAKGVYSAMLSAALDHASKKHFDKIISSTQVNNFPIQRRWSHFGFRTFGAKHTFHKWYV